MGNKEVPLDMVGGTVFGRYPKISSEQTFNLIKSDGWMVPFAGYLNLLNDSNTSQQGRGIFTSINLRKQIVVIDNSVYLAIPSGEDDIEPSFQKIGVISTSVGPVYIDENDNKQIGICDRKNIYIYDYGKNEFNKVTLDFSPGYIVFQDGYFIATDNDRPQWRLSAPNNGNSWPPIPSNALGFQTKPDLPIAARRMPGKGNMLMVFGSTITECWYDLGSPNQIVPYNKNVYFNIDYGAVNAATIDANNDVIVWVGINEKSGPRILVSDGGKPVVISNEGIDFRMSQLKNPFNSFGFLFEQDGHQIYQVTFVDDNVTFAFDFKEKIFYTLTDHELNYHPARRVAYFGNSYYFISNKDGGYYEFNSKYQTLNGKECPRIRIPKTFALPNRDRFVTNYITFPTEMGVFIGNNNIQRVDLALSKDGGQIFGNYVGHEFNAAGKFQNRFYERNLGMANELTMQFRFYGKGRFIFTNGFLGYYK